MVFRIGPAVAAAAIMAVVACWAPDACAHAALIGSDPADGAVLAKAPDEITLRFNEPVSPLAMRFVRPDGEATDLAVSSAADGRLTLAVGGHLARGGHLLSWRVISADGHPVGGSLAFAVGAPGGRASAPAAGPDVGAAALVWLSRSALLIALSFGVGGAFFWAWIAPGRSGARSLATPIILLGIAADLTSLGLLGVDLRGGSFTELLSAETWADALQTSFGATFFAAAAALVAALLSLRSAGGTWARALSAASVALAGTALASSGHAATASPEWLTRPAAFIHTACVALWLGSLPPIFDLLRRHATVETRTALRRFSAAAVPVVVALVLAGIALTLVQMRALSDFWTSGYGIVLGLKLTAFMVLLALAAANRAYFTAALRRGDQNASAWFRRSVAAEIALGAVIIGLVAGLRLVPPSRAEELLARPFVHIHTDKGMAEVTLVARGNGSYATSILLLGEDGAPLAAREVRVAFARPDAGIEAIERPAQPASDGIWRVPDISLPGRGRWQVRVEALVSDFDKLTLEDKIDVNH
jgi:copper transport protein